MALNRELKATLIFIFIIVILFRTFINPKLLTTIISNNIKDKGEADGNRYEKFEGEKIILSSKGEELKGEFGELHLTPFIIEPTASFVKEQTYVSNMYEMFESSSKWIFEDKSLEEIRTMLQESGLNNLACEELLANTSAAKDGKGFITTPPDEVLWNLTEENRAKLYPLIGKDINNAMYNQPVYYNSSNGTEWLYSSGLRIELIEKLKKLIYVENGISYISDIHLMLPLLNNEEERVRLIQIVYRTRALDVQLIIKEGQNISNIADYWGKFGRKELIKPMLESLSGTTNGGQIDILKLLPQIPQSRLNTFSGLEEFQTDCKDCHWTTMNFFNNKADGSYYNIKNSLLLINGISKPSQDSSFDFGDVVSIFNGNNELTHSCTYIADNLVLTKNGTGNLHPFVITYLDRTIPLYGSKTVYYSRLVGDTHSIDLGKF